MGKTAEENRSENRSKIRTTLYIGSYKLVNEKEWH